jgi:hypothetical protein
MPETINLAARSRMESCSSRPSRILSSSHCQSADPPLVTVWVLLLVEVPLILLRSRGRCEAR